MGINSAIDISKEQKKCLLSLLKTHLPNTKIWAYGSRVKWSARPNSDLDLVAFTNKQQTLTIENLKEALAESELPFSVDLLVWDDIPERFQANIKARYVELQSDEVEGLPSGWRVVELGSVANLTNIKFDLKDLALNKYISTDNMLKNLGGIECATKIPSTGKVKAFQDGDVLFSNIRTYFRKVWYATVNGGCSNDILVFHPTKEMYSRYMYYLLADNTFIDYTDKTSKGTKMPRGDKSAILKYSTYLPPLPEQKAIAHILGKLDDKIELNRQINQTLETMAQTLFKSWFVDFDPVIDNAIKAGNKIPKPLQHKADKRNTTKSTIPKDLQALFPDSFVFNEALKKWIPQGWEVKAISNVGKVVCGKTPSKSKKEYYGGNIPFIKIPNMHNEVYVMESSEYLTELGEKSQIKKRISKGSIAVSCIATVGKVILVDKESHTNQQINSVTPYQDCYQYYLYFMMLSLNKHFHDLASSGSATLNMNTSTFSNIRIIMPNDDVLEVYSRQVEAYFKNILFNQKQTQTLTKMRDNLLPKLISGKIRV